MLMCTPTRRRLRAARRRVRAAGAPRQPAGRCAVGPCPRLPRSQRAPRSHWRSWCFPEPATGRTLPLTSGRARCLPGGALRRPFPRGACDLVLWWVAL